MRSMVMLVALLAIPLLLGGGGDVRLPAETRPEQLALANDGSLWMTTEYDGITRLHPDGRRTKYAIDHPVDIVRGPDEAMWFAAFETVGRIDLTGRAKRWRVPGEAITAAGGALWFTNEGAIERRSPQGAVGRFAVTGARASFDMTSIASGPDGALWFTQSGVGRDAPDGIGRMTTDGRYASWPLPRRRAGPIAIAAGPDGALWFTEENAHAIGRITTTGAVSEFPLRSGLSPYDITSADGALWFTADRCIGRITTAGQVTTWPVRHARRLLGIAAAGDGSFWLADNLGHAVRRFTPTARAFECHPPTITRRAGSTRAALVYRRLDTFEKGNDYFTDARVRISRAGSQRFSEVAPQSPRGRPEYRVFGNTKPFAVRDLDGDREPEVMLELYWNGTHCCTWSRIYRYDARRDTYVPRNHFWGNSGAVPTLKDLDGGGRPEFLSTDDRFTDVFEGYAGSVRPIQIWSYDHGRFRDVTRRYPGRIRRDAARIWRVYLQSRGKASVRGILPAWAADQYMLGRGDTVDRALENARRRGYLARDPVAYIETLKRLLRKTGYIRG